MQPGANPDDLHTILSRYHTWAEKQPANGNGNRNGAATEGVRELTYEEALERHRVRRGGAGARRTRAVAAEKPEEAAKAEPAAEETASRGTETGPATGQGPETGSGTEMRARPEWAEGMEFPGRREAEMIEAAVSPQEELPFAATLGGATANRSGDTAEGAETAAVAMAATPAEAKPTIHSKRAAAQARSNSAQGRTVALRTAVGSGTERKADSAKAGRCAGGKKSAAKGAGPGIEKQPEFRQVLAKTVRSVKTAAQAKRQAVKKRAVRKEAVAAGGRTALVRKAVVAAKKKAEPERTRRITTRFSTSEERRIEKAAAAAGMSVSAWLRKCALAAETGGERARAQGLAARTSQGGREKTRVSGARARRKGAVKAEAAAPMQLFAQAANPSLVGGWLGLLRQRFLGSPTRFAERA